MKTVILMWVALLALASAGWTDSQNGSLSPTSKDRRGAALRGYDAVAYFTEQQPVKGAPAFRSRHEGADYYFASADNKAAFDADPSRYVPAYGGYSGYQVATDQLKEPKAKHWSITEGRLVLESSKKDLAAWNRDPEGNLARADRNWPGLVERELERPVYTPTGPGADYNPNGPQPGDLAWPGY